MRRRHRTERGEALVETALVLPLLMLLVLGTADAGFVFRSSMKVGAAARAGARTAALSGTTVMADDDVLAAVGTVLATDAALRVDLVVVYDAGRHRSEVPTVCLSATSIEHGGDATARCTVYRAADVDTALAASLAGATSPLRPCGTPTQYWCPAGRKATQTSAQEVDRVGVYVRTNYRASASWILRVTRLDDEAVMAVEPLVVAR